MTSGIELGSANIVSKLRRIDSVAIVGASPIEGRIGYELLHNIVKFGFKGEIYPVNPKYERVLGFKCYRTPKDIPNEVDVGIVAIPAPQVPDVVGDLCSKDVDVVVVISSGFREKGRSDLEELLRVRAVDCGIRIVGPNSAGITSSPAKLHASIEVLPTPGRVAVVSHSGAVGGVAIYELQKLGSGVSYFISTGNSLDVGVEEVLEGLAEDTYTDAVILYVEWVKDGKRFMKTLQDLSKIKPVAVVKGGWGAASSKAVLSHTGGVAVSYEVFKAAVRQSGAIVVEDVEEAVAISEVLRKFETKERSFHRVLLLTNSGGYGILVASHLEREGVDLPQVDAELRKQIEETTGRDFSGSNPVDFGGDSKSTDIARVLQIDSLRNYYDAVVVVYVPTSAESPRDICESFRSSLEKVPTMYFAAGGGANWITRCLSEVKPAVSRVPFISKIFSVLKRRNSAIPELKSTNI
ncbi:MAG: CoA-binding protein [Sulfolobales archaeon]|nr:CoA-binding protein [Sulfolobales archaeon]MDW8083315.1 CoA-binding protein [Sulfolobales archaeon]